MAPCSTPEAALELAPFVVAMHGAVTYSTFLQQVEEAEWPYHLDDVPRCLEAATALATGE